MTHAILLFSLTTILACGSDDGASSKGETTLTFVIDNSGTDVRLGDPLITIESVKEVLVTGDEGTDLPFVIYAQNATGSRSPKQPHPLHSRQFLQPLFTQLAEIAIDFITDEEINVNINL